MELEYLLRAKFSAAARAAMCALARGGRDGVLCSTKAFAPASATRPSSPLPAWLWP